MTVRAVNLSERGLGVTAQTGEISAESAQRVRSYEKRRFQTTVRRSLAQIAEVIAKSFESPRRRRRRHSPEHASDMLRGRCSSHVSVMNTKRDSLLLLVRKSI